MRDALEGRERDRRLETDKSAFQHCKRVTCIAVSESFSEIAGERIKAAFEAFGRKDPAHVLVRSLALSFALAVLAVRKPLRVSMPRSLRQLDFLAQTKSSSLET